VTAAIAVRATCKHLDERHPVNSLVPNPTSIKRRESVEAKMKKPPSMPNAPCLYRQSGSPRSLTRSILITLDQLWQNEVPEFLSVE